MNMFEVSPKRNWKNITTIVFILLCFMSLGFFSTIYQEFAQKDPEREMTINLGAIWAFLLLVWLGSRFRYRQEKKKDSNRIKRN